MFDKNALPSPLPSCAPLTSPAMSVMVRTAGTVFLGLATLTKKSKRSSGTGTFAVEGSIVQKG